MRLILPLLVAAFAMLSGNVQSQTESIDEVYIDIDSIRKPFKPDSKPYVFVRSKKGKSGVNRTPEADQAVKYPISEIILVFTEETPDEMAEREENNYARWENLFKTYPEFFQHSSSYMSVCQCNPSGDTATFKKVQGFYIYYEADEPIAISEPVKEQVVAETKPVAKKEEPPVTATENSTEKQASEPEPKKESQKKKPEPEPEPEVAAAEPEKAAAGRGEREPVREAAAESADEEAEEAAPVKVAKPAAVAKKNVAGKPRRARDPKACRPACFGYGDEDLNTFFANLELSKKQKKKAKKAPVNLTLQLNADGTIKKVLAAGPNPEINEVVKSAVEGMGAWNSAVKAGLAVKSQVRMTLKYDGATKALKPSQIITNPRPSPKCQCASDSEIFGSD